MQDETGRRAVKRKCCFKGVGHLADRARDEARQLEVLEDLASGELKGSPKLGNMTLAEAEEFGADGSSIIH